MSRYVWVVESGCYSSAYIEGVYDSIEAVIAAHPVPASVKKLPHGIYREGGWRGDDERGWDNGLDWHERMQADRHEVRSLDREAPRPG